MRGALGFSYLHYIYFSTSHTFRLSTPFDFSFHSILIPFDFPHLSPSRTLPPTPFESSYHPGWTNSWRQQTAGPPQGKTERCNSQSLTAVKMVGQPCSLLSAPFSMARHLNQLGPLKRTRFQCRRLVSLTFTIRPCLVHSSQGPQYQPLDPPLHPCLVLSSSGPQCKPPPPVSTPLPTPPRLNPLHPVKTRRIHPPSRSSAPSRIPIHPAPHPPPPLPTPRTLPQLRPQKPSPSATPPSPAPPPPLQPSPPAPTAVAPTPPASPPPRTPTSPRCKPTSSTGRGTSGACKRTSRGTGPRTRAWAPTSRPKSWRSRKRRSRRSRTRSPSVSARFTAGAGRARRREAARGRRTRFAR